jgi:hypothetical protein
MIYYIYKIVCNDVSITDFYVGSTSNIRNRKYQHKSDCNNENRKSYNLKIYQTIRTNGGWDNWRMVVLEEMVEGTTLLQSRMREEHYRLELQSTLNLKSCGTGLTIKEYKKEYDNEYHKTEKFKKYQKEYCKTDKYKEYKKEYNKQYYKQQKLKKEQSKL